MGLLTLEDMRTEVQSSLGDSGLTNERLDLWINMGYLEVVGAHNFEQLKVCSYVTTVEGEGAYPLPPGLINFVSISDETNRVELKPIQLEAFHGGSRENRGKPRSFTRRKDRFELWPTPDGAYRLAATYIKEPDRLSETNDRTVIPATWDAAILLLAKHYGAESLGQGEKSAHLFQRAMGYMRSRKEDRDQQPRARAGGLQVAWDEDDLRDQRRDW